MFSMLALLLISVVRLSTCHNILDVEYSERVFSDTEGDGFGFSLATSHHKLVIGAPNDNGRGSVMVDDHVRVNGPEDGNSMGLHVDVNQQFMVVSGEFRAAYYVYVYQSNSCYDMVASFPIDGEVYSLVISDDNTIAVSYSDSMAYWLTIYHYDGSATWNIAKKFKLENQGDSLAVYGDIIVVGLPFASGAHGRLRIINRVGGEWAQGQAIEQDGAWDFGWSVAIHGQHLAVVSESVVFTYMLDHHSNTWINNGKLSVPGESSVLIQNDTLLATLIDMGNHPDVCGIVYKLKTTNSNGNSNSNKNNNNNNINSNNEKQQRHY